MIRLLTNITFLFSVSAQAVVPGEAWHKDPELACTQALTVSEIEAQFKIQKKKERQRDLAEYDKYLFKWSEGSPALKKLMVTAGRLSKNQPFNLRNFLQSYVRLRRRPMAWADEGAGFAIAMREIKRDSPEFAHQITMTAVDLFNWEQTRRVKKLRDHSLSKYGPGYALGSMADATPPGQDLITSVESIQYAPDKMAAIADWYNKLNDGGILIVSSEHYWSQEIKFEAFFGAEDKTPMMLFFEELKANSIPFAIAGESLLKIRTLAIVKKTGTRLSVRARPSQLWRNGVNYTFSYYSDPRSPLILSGF